MFGIYVHIPFCVKKCGYCDFYSIPVGHDTVPHRKYLEAMVAQLERDTKTFGLRDRSVASVYFGGGTPSIMPPSFFEGVISAISGQFVIEKDAEISAEINPATADSNWFCSARAAGITRASIGVQSFGPRLLKTLGRIHSSEDAMRAIAEAQDAQFKSIGIDLMYAIDGESVSDLEEDLRTAMTFQTEHISAYQLTVEEGTPLASLRESIVDSRWSMVTSDEEQLKQMRIVERMLGRGGWNRYEISNFAKPGFECRHNLNYWRYGEYLGLGAGATSFARSQDREIGRSQTSFARRWTQIRDINKYIGGSQEFAESEEIDKKTAMAEFCFMGLRMTEGISRLRFKEIFETEFDEVYEKECKALVEDGLLTAKDDVIALTSKGIELSNQVFQRFL